MMDVTRKIVKVFGDMCNVFFFSGIKMGVGVVVVADERRIEYGYQEWSRELLVHSMHGGFRRGIIKHHYAKLYDSSNDTSFEL